MVVFRQFGLKTAYCVSAVTTDYLSAIAHLPPGAALWLDGVPWEEYENLLGDLGESYAVRIFYDHGKVEIIAPASTHEKRKGLIHTLVMALSDELDIDLESLGSTTLRAATQARGAEPLPLHSECRHRDR